jgi:hypothetical protein
MRVKTSPLFEIALVLVCLDHVARFLGSGIVSDGHARGSQNARSSSAALAIPNNSVIDRADNRLDVWTVL